MRFIVFVRATAIRPCSSAYHANSLEACSLWSSIARESLDCLSAVPPAHSRYRSVSRRRSRLCDKRKPLMSDKLPPTAVRILTSRLTWEGNRPVTHSEQQLHYGHELVNKSRSVRPKFRSGGPFQMTTMSVNVMCLDCHGHRLDHQHKRTPEEGFRDPHHAKQDVLSD